MNVDEELRASGLRVTVGRRALLELLTDSPHADAESVRRGLMAAGHDTSVQSVHNMLADLTAAGLLRRIEPERSPARYERRVADNHHHAVCRSCGAVADVDCAVGYAPCLEPSDTAGFEIDTADVVFWGTCPACAEARRDAVLPDNASSAPGPRTDGAPHGAPLRPAP